MTSMSPERLDDIGEKRGAKALELHREAATLALQNRPGFDIATISEEEFEEGLHRLQVRQRRMQRILDTVLIEGVHYGNPKDRNGRSVFKKPMLLQPGMEELQKLFRLTPRHAQAPIIEFSESFASVTVTIDLQDSAGRTVATRSGSCNTLEKRFEGKSGGYTYKDAREMVHNCLTMAEKRALKLAVSAATGATAFFAAEEEMEKALEEDVPEIVPWTPDEVSQVVKAAAKAGLKTKTELKEFIKHTLGRDEVGTGADVQALLEAMTRRGVQPVADATYAEMAKRPDVPGPTSVASPLDQGDAFEVLP